MFKKILVGYDGSQGSRLALKCALDLAQSSGALVTALWVEAPHRSKSGLPEEPMDQAEVDENHFAQLKQEAEFMAAGWGRLITCATLRGHPVPMLVGLAQTNGFDLIVLGHSNHSGMWGRLLGDTADRIGYHSHCSVLIAKW